MQMLRSSLLTVPHGFTTRHGGVSRAPFESLNTSTTIGDLPDNVTENLSRIVKRLNAEPVSLRTVNQVHGTAVVEANTAATEALEADGLWTASANVLLGIRTADCVPILLHDPKTHRVAALHAGWRGTLAGIVTILVRRWIDTGSELTSLAIAIGPHIRACCFEVNTELAQRFAARFGAQAVRHDNAKLTVDLNSSLRRELNALGLDDGQIDSLPQCTFCDDSFFSHRRDRGTTGRQLSLIRL
jgi:polyphenol oxidase